MFISVLTNGPVSKQQTFHSSGEEEVERNEPFSNVEGCGLLADDSAIGGRQFPVHSAAQQL